MTREQAALRVLTMPAEPLARAVLGAIVAHGAVEPDGFVWVRPVAELAAAAGVSERACRNRLASLAGLGLACRHHRGAPRVAFAALASVSDERHVVPVERHEAPLDRHVVPVERHVVPEGPSRAAEDHRPARGAVQAARGAGREDGTALAMRAQAPARGSLLGSFQEPILARARAEVVVDLASASPRTHEAQPTTSPTLHAAAGAHPSPMAHPMADEPSPEATPEANPDHGRLACAAWERALGVMTLPGGHVDALKVAYAAHGLDVVVEAADRVAAYLADNPRSRSFAVRMPRVVADRVADVLKAKAAPAKGNPNLREMSTCPKFWEEQAALANARLPAHTMPTPEELEQMPW